MTTPFPANLADLQTLASNYLNDPANARYALALLNNHFDIAQDRWNRAAHICRSTMTLSTVAGADTILLSGLAGTPLEILRVTHKGVDLAKRSKAYFDRYSGSDWTTSQGTPTDFVIDINANPVVIIVYPTPQGNDAGANLGVEYVLRHDPMVNPTDTPFTTQGVVNTLILPFAAGLAVEVAADILAQDPTAETVKKAESFREQANDILSDVVAFYDRLETDEPMRMAGGRNWRF